MSIGKDQEESDGDASEKEREPDELEATDHAQRSAERFQPHHTLGSGGFGDKSSLRDLASIRDKVSPICHWSLSLGEQR